MVDREWLERMPKVELHLHLEGAIPHDALWQLIEKYGGDETVSTPADLPGRFVYRDFPHFIEVWLWKQTFLRETDDLTLIAEAFARELVSRSIVYAEVFVSPSDLSMHGIAPADSVVAIRRGLDRVPAADVALIVDVVRDQGWAKSLRTLEEVAEAKDEARIIGITIGGSEQAFPPEPFRPVYERARALGLHTTAHAGEAAGAGSVWGAINELEVERIGHGIRSIEDPALVEYLASHRIPLEVCPGSNVCTGVTPRIEDHPVRRLFDAGVLVTINSDDPAMFGLTLAGEFETISRVHGFSRDEIVRLTRNAVDASWASDGRKAELRTLVEAAAR